MRLLARKNGMSLNQRGLFQGVIRDPKTQRKTNNGILIASRTEREIFDRLGVVCHFWISTSAPIHHQVAFLLISSIYQTSGNSLGENHTNVPLAHEMSRLPACGILRWTRNLYNNSICSDAST
ncbi:hypothetical protein RSOLAG1IB_09124 [Rhizoctonia solani AG-1 IB]|uniref:DNA polymerase beta thumb domain-containing protein n=1 Tax=Thanatephorus cucumeris (strain AG1-IB / isolate 7/3/14) TaxID=1108050 RepID=A0A0B7FSI8_THACB|nr:hypothetical protein RSOLAG1IB_09124 [Rhizoctonia solani AG-1 IB]